ncbi:MAG: phosphoribosyl-AMP cyclohydrolase [Zoogloeaceae bacterium]|jgi:phosphoribosyl-AMP cyclohydrolase|nr:phosphoribosyl-AMP cyclohydrolase [Zoogloeaceae bacterium]
MNIDDATAEALSASVLDLLHWDENGLIPVIAQDAQTGRVLMLAWMNPAALQCSAREGVAVYWSRSRQRLWKKGEESGHVQRVRAIRADCDGDALLLLVEQQGGIACHTGRESCFFRELAGQTWQDIDPVLKDPQDIYGHKP